MSNLGLSQRIWQIADGAVQRALEALANTYDTALRTLNKAFDFTDSTTTVRNALTVLGNTTAQSVAAQAVSTPGGFKSVIGPWQRSSSTLPTTPTALVWATDTAGTNAANLVQGFIATHPGSIIGMQLAGLVTAATTITVTVYKNLTATAATFSMPFLTTNSYSYTAFPKGSVTFVAGDRLEIYHSAAVSTTGQLVSSFTVEMAA